MDSKSFGSVYGGYVGRDMSAPALGATPTASYLTSSPRASTPGLMTPGATPGITSGTMAAGTTPGTSQGAEATAQGLLTIPQFSALDLRASGLRAQELKAPELKVSEPCTTELARRLAGIGGGAVTSVEAERRPADTGSAQDGGLTTAPRDSVDILVVDDSPVIRDTTSQLLREEGYQVRVACHGREALLRVAEHMPDVILLDLMMPLMDGWEFAARLKALPGGDCPRILLLSAVRGLEIESTGTCADGCLGKPYQVDDLLNQVAHAVTHPRRPAHAERVTLDS